MKNLFLSGEISVGKSTVIKKIIEQLNISKEEIEEFCNRERFPYGDEPIVGDIATKLKNIQ